MNVATTAQPIQQPANGKPPTEQQTQPVQQTQQPPPLWQQPIEVLGLTGDFASGKTLFALSICPGPQTRIYDTEKSAGTYQSIGFDRVDLSQEMLQAHPNGYKAIDVFQFWHNHIRAIPPGKFRVIVLDTVSEIENGLVDYIRAYPQQFGLTPDQLARAGGLLWGVVKDFWKSILSDLASRCEVFVFTSHLKSEFKGGRPTGKRIAKGKETLMELASLYLWLERESDKNGVVPDVPAAVVVKSRLASTVVADGEVKILPTLPPRIPQATPQAIRAYMAAPPDYAKLKKAEKLQIHEATEEELQAMRLAAAEAERDAAAMNVQRMTMAQQAYAQRNPNPQQAAQQQPVPPYMKAALDLQRGALPTQQPTAQPHPVDANGPTIDQANQIKFLISQLLREDCERPMPGDKGREILERIPNLTKEGAIELTSKLFKLAKSQFPDLKIPDSEHLKNLFGPNS